MKKPSLLQKIKTLFKSKLSKEEKQLKRLEDKKRAFIHAEMVDKDLESRRYEKTPSTDAFIVLDNVNKIYPNHVQAVFDFNLAINKGEFIVFVGPSGCGKSTTLRMIAGLEDITCGDLFIDGEFTNDVMPKKRNIAMVFQNYALYPNMSVYDNMAFSLKIHHLSAEEIDRRVLEAAQILDITDYLDRKPAALSGGQRQRVALGRAIVRDAKVFLMDEPLSNLDAKLRVQMRSEIVKLHRRLKATTIYVTHDQTEAMTMADRIVVMNKGYVQQIGSPKEIYTHPINKFVATFIGAPSMNMLEAVYDKGIITLPNGYEIALEKNRIKCHDDFYINLKENYLKEISLLEKEEFSGKEKEIKELQAFNELKIQKIKEKISQIDEIILTNKHSFTFGIRPEDIVANNAIKLLDNHSSVYEDTIIFAELLGNEYYVHTKIKDKILVSKVSANVDVEVNTTLSLAFNLDHIHLFDDITGNSII